MGDLAVGLLAGLGQAP